MAPTRDGVRRDHVARYEWAADYLAQFAEGNRVADFACGTGYGTQLLAQSGLRAVGFDISQETLDYASKHYAHGRATYRLCDGRDPGELGSFDAAVCFETIEHLENPLPLLKALRAAPLLLASVPNETVFPWKGYAFHYRHYTKDEFESLLASAGWEVVGWFGQTGPESEVEENCNGRTLIAVAKKVKHEAVALEPTVGIVPEKKAGPERVAILGLGPSVRGYLELVKRAGGRDVLFDEVWGINALGDVFACDRIYHMDDVRIQEIRAMARPDCNIAAMLRWMKKYRGPIYTSRAHPDYPCLVEFPLAEVIGALRFAYFNSTAAYAVAHAVHIGVKTLTVFGNDFTYPNAHDAEKGRACVEFWLGMAAARGIKIRIPKESSLMDGCHSLQQKLYGYDTLDVALTDTGTSLEVQITPHDRRPTADEIEANYDHSRHPSPLVDDEQKGASNG